MCGPGNTLLYFVNVFTWGRTYVDHVTSVDGFPFSLWICWELGLLGTYFVPSTRFPHHRPHMGTLSLGPAAWRLRQCIFAVEFSQDRFVVAQMVKSLPAVWETQVRSLGWEDPLEKEMATHCSILAWWATVHGVAKSQTWLSDFFSFLWLTYFT